MHYGNYRLCATLCAELLLSFNTQLCILLFCSNLERFTTLCLRQNRLSSRVQRKKEEKWGVGNLLLQDKSGIGLFLPPNGFKRTGEILNN